MLIVQPLSNEMYMQLLRVLWANAAQAGHASCLTYKKLKTWQARSSMHAAADTNYND
jgi:hypothetical protein